MRNLLLVQTIPLQFKCSTMTFDGRFFYICQDNEPVVHRLDMRGNMICSFPMEQCVRSICYDSRERCFWGLARTPARKIIKLSEHWRVLDTIDLMTGNTVLNHIAYNKKTDELILNSYLAIYCISKDGTIRGKYNDQPEQMCMAAGALGEDILNVSNAKFASLDIVSLVAPVTCDEKSITCLPERHRCCSFFPGEQSPEGYTLFLLTKKAAEQYLLEYLYLPQVPTRPEYIPAHVHHTDDEMVCIREIII